MKRYSVSYMREVNRHASKTGLLFQYSERTDDPETVIKAFEESELTEIKYSDTYSSYAYIGMKITDSQTKKTVYCVQRAEDADELPAKATIHKVL